MTPIKTRKSRDIQSDNNYEEKIPYMQTFRFIKVTRYHEGINEKSVYNKFFLNLVIFFKFHTRNKKIETVLKKVRKLGII